MKYTLVPIGMGRASLNRIVMDSEDKTKQVVVLGRNATTGLDAGGDNSIHVSRQHVELFFRGQSLCLKAVARQDGIVHLNNSACDRQVKELHDGDTISLVGPLSFYNYAVQESLTSPLPTGEPASSTMKTDAAKVSNAPSFNKNSPAIRLGRAVQRQESNEAIVFDFTDDEPAVKRVRLNTEKREVIDLDGASPQQSSGNGKLGKISGDSDEVVSLLSSAASSTRSGKSVENVDLVSTAPHSMASTMSHASLPPQPALSANPPTSSSTASATSTNPPSNTLPNPPPPGAQEKVQNLLRQYECAICYETLASAVSLSPCGDTFCFPCISEWSSRSQSCPSCNSAFDLSRIVANRVTDNAIREILKDDADQLAAWEARVTQGNEARKVYFEKLSAPPKPPAAPATQQANTRPALGHGGVIHIDSVSGPSRSGVILSVPQQAAQVPQAHRHVANGSARRWFGAR